MQSIPLAPKRPLILAIAATLAVLALLMPIAPARAAGPESEHAKITASDAGDSDDFGWAVAISGDTAVVGARDDDDAGSNSGAAYVFVRASGVWSQQQKLTAADAATGDQFGYAVAIDGDTILVSA